ncbi:MAG: excinuclease ABC subunit UvrC [Alphaproteobacteria bacterium]|jgi:excinuclease ABC subunit C|nr:excinuclease ABC subunit UvrC [Alphaproteobacteria bacterium]MBT5389913.1 excinuclease ABC subunit UvrC [Alphaproteobacteria bacterium]MBT5540640.1 excinuclease ABC subunit UvrC [Alphaproteobacteria bacterium]
MTSNVPTSLQKGIQALKKALKTVPGSPGVYRMLSERQEVLYVGKAKNLKKRVTSYTHWMKLPNRIQRMVGETRSLEIITTHTEAEALLLEANLIKKFKTRYNVLLRDDKSFPYIRISKDHPFPQISRYRGARKKDAINFGPFASVTAVNDALISLQKAFLLRSCSDSIFSNRTRPCLLYHIKRCSAPCVGKIKESEYAHLVEETSSFLSGKSRQIQENLSRKMHSASKDQAYEKAAAIRDRIKALTRLQTHQTIHIPNLRDADIVAAYATEGSICIQIFFYRNGSNYGNRAYFPRHTEGLSLEDVLGSFLAQFYAANEIPKHICVSHVPTDKPLLVEALSQKAEKSIELTKPSRGTKVTLIQSAIKNAQEALLRHLSENATQHKHLKDLAKQFELDRVPKRIEVYDNSHIQGAQAYGAMIVIDREGFCKKAYRKFKFKEDFAKGDDYSMMREVLTRRFKRGQLEHDKGNGDWPDLVLIDGGAGHLSVVQSVFADLGLSDVALAAIAKGPERNAGRETFHLPGKTPFQLPPNTPLLHFLQRIRDEAHRFAIGTHRAGRIKAIRKSIIDDIPGIGAKRKRDLLRHFGSAQDVARAGLKDLQAAPGIHKGLAEKIYFHFHPS